MSQDSVTPDIRRVGTVTVELSYDDALRLWVLVHDPARAGTHQADERIGNILSDAIAITERDHA